MPGGVKPEGIHVAPGCERRGSRVGPIGFLRHFILLEPLCDQKYVHKSLSPHGLTQVKGITRQNCTQKIFDTVIRLNCNRILGRLSSKHFSPPAYLRAVTRDPTSQQLVTVAQRLTASKKKSGLVEDLDAFRSDVRMLHESFQELETSTEEDRLHSIGRTVKAAFRVTGDGVSLQDRLRRLSCNVSTLNSRVIHEINKVSNYWRISCTLAQLSRCREYRALFAEPKLATVQHYEPDTRGSSPRHVHAEIQLIVHYELWPTECLPRVIGASKQACYLCYAFVKAHKQYHILRSHGQIYNQWTVPDCRNYTQETLERFQRALSAVNRGVLDEIRKLRTSPKVSRAHPLQSLINLRIPDFPDGSDTTAKSVKGSQVSLALRQLKGVDAKSQSSKMPSLAPAVDLRNSECHADGGRLRQDSETGVLKCQDGELTRSQLEGVDQDTYINVPVSTAKQTSIATDLSSGPTSLTLDWLDLHFYPPEAAGSSRMKMELARCESNKTTQCDGENTIEIARWQLDQEITFPINKEDPELEIMFVGGLGCIKMRIALYIDH